MFAPLAVGAASEDAPQPVIDRVILKAKKKKQPVVDRVILKKKKTTAPPADPQTDPAVWAPAPPDGGIELQEPDEPTLEEVASDESPGSVLDLSVISGDMDQTQLGFGYWFSDSWGVALRTGLNWSREDGPITTAAGTRRVSSLTYAVVPELSLQYSPMQRLGLRLVLEGGGGAALSKAPRQKKLDMIYHAFAGPAIQWLVAPPFSLQVGERVELLTNSKPISYDVGLSTQLTASWWFE